VDQTVQVLRKQVPGLLSEANAINAQNDCELTTTPQLVDCARSLSLFIERQRALRDRTVVLGLAATARPIIDADKQARSAPIQRALAINVSSYGNLVSNLSAAFPSDARYSRIESISVSQTTPAKYQSAVTDPSLQDFLTQINGSADGSADAMGLARLKRNLVVGMESLSDLRLSLQRLTRIHSANETLSSYMKENENISALQSALDSNSTRTIELARKLNSAAHTLKLESDLSLLPVGTWYASKELTIKINQGQRFGLYDIGAVVDDTRTEVIGTEPNPSPKNAQIAAAAASTVRTTKVRVYNTYRFQLGFGFVYSGAPDDRFQVVKQTTGSVTETRIEQTRSRDYNILATVDVLVYPFARTNFPWKARYVGEEPPAFYKDFAALVGFSITSPNRDFLFGGAWMRRRSPIGLKAGWHVALRDYPPQNVPLGVPISQEVGLEQEVKGGLFVGLTFTTDFFSKVITPIFKAP
jgi:hypothetical protein